jgi:glutaredoxin
MGKIIAYCKFGCPYSEGAANLLKQFSGNVEIISLYSDYSNVGIELNGINGKNNNMSKLDFFSNHFEQTYGVNLNGHRTFPVILYRSSSNENFFVGGYSDLQEIFNLAKQTNDVDTLKPHSSCVNNFKQFDTDGKRKLYCKFLILLGKITE